MKNIFLAFEKEGLLQVSLGKLDLLVLISGQIKTWSSAYKKIETILKSGNQNHEKNQNKMNQNQYFKMIHIKKMNNVKYCRIKMIKLLG